MKLFFLCFFIQFFFSSPGSITQNLRDGYAEMAEADTSLGILILVNKHHKLAEGYRPHDLVPVDDRYNRGIMNLLRSEAAAAFAQMCSTAEKDSIILWNHSAYRSDTVQRQLHENAVERENEIHAKNGVDAHASHAIGGRRSYRFRRSPPVV